MQAWFAPYPQPFLPWSPFLLCFPDPTPTLGSSWSSCTPHTSSSCWAALLPRRLGSGPPRSSMAAPLPSSEEGGDWGWGLGGTTNNLGGWEGNFAWGIWVCVTYIHQLISQIFIIIVVDDVEGKKMYMVWSLFSSYLYCSWGEMTFTYKMWLKRTDWRR